MSAGKVYLVGAGPGDPGLMTLRGDECLRTAEVVLYDALVHEGLLDHARGAELIFVGKRGGEASPSQQEIEEIMIRKATEGKRVVRLKGGDPFLFARGGEEAERCAQAGIEFEVVPGVSAALAVPAYAGIPLTHRDLASSVSFVTAHEAPGKKEAGLPWKELLKSDTLVVFMGIGEIEKLAARLIEEGKSPETPVALIRWGTRVEQQTLVSRLGSVGVHAKERGLASPTLIVVGEVVKLRERLQWFEKRPLFGKRIVITRALSQAGELIRTLNALGAETLSLPTIEICPPASEDPLGRIADRLAEYDWIVFSSTNAVETFTRHLFARGHDLRDLGKARIIAVGSKTAGRVRDLFLRVDLVPEEFRSEGILKALEGFDIVGKSFLIPRVETARDILPEALKKRGASVDVVGVYRTQVPKNFNPRVLQLLEERKVHWVLFTSSSTVKNFFAMIPGGTARNLGSVKFACIGPVTAETLRAHGFHASVVPKDYTVRALVAAIVEHRDDQV